MIDALMAEIKTVEDWLKARTRRDRDMRLLMSIPGIGRFSAALILAEIGDIGFFKTKRKLASFVGVVPGARNSDATRRDTSLKKDSNRYIRWLLAEAVPKAVRVVPAWQRLYDRVCAGNPRRRSKAKVAVTHKRVGAIWRVLATKEPFDRLHNCPELQTQTASPA
jgi:transposase